MSPAIGHGPGHLDRLALYALQALPSSETRGIGAHLAECPRCRRELDSLRPVLDSFVAWPRALLRPPRPLCERLEGRIARQTGRAPPAPLDTDWKEPEWKEAAPGLSYQLLSVDPGTHRVTMLVRLEAGAEYPPHTHAGLEELHLLDGELWIDDRRLHPGDCNRAVAGTGDTRVWSERGCTCVLITSHRDILK